MKITRLFFRLTVVLMFLSTTVNAQIVKKINLNAVEIAPGVVSSLGTPQIRANAFKVFSIDIESLKYQLSGIAHTDIENNGFVAQISLPLPDGTKRSYLAKENFTMDPQLAASFPEIKSYDAYGETDGSSVKWDITPHGFHAMITTPGEGTVFIDPLIKGNTEYYIVYNKKNFITDKTMECLLEGIASEDKPNSSIVKSFGSCELRTYRLALAATGEYTAFHGGTVAGALAAQVTTMNRVNGVYEREMAIRMNIIANNNLIIYTNGGTDPYTNNNGGTMLNENQTNINTVIGAANYDIGHVFSTGGGGIAQLQSPCTANKARGVTGSGAPVGDPFDIDYVAHEMGHQFGGNHTFNSSNSGSCSGNANTATSYEPGSGSSIMAYAGICAPVNVQNNSDDYFHTINLQEIGAFITSGGHTCPVKTPLSNVAPVVAPVTSISVPQGTPFFLTASATDANSSNVLTYCWEEMDAGTSTTAPTATQTSKANFRTFDPTTNPTRYFPNLASLAANGPFTWEVLPTVARTMNFRVTVRDNAAGGGCNDEENMTVSVVATTTPFAVTYPTNTGISWTGATSQTVTWTVANTTAAPISCANVDILLSTDGGLTYPTVLASNVPNDGSQVITVPNTPSTTCRIMVRCAGGYFFDISNNNFAIVASTFDYTLTATPATLAICQPSNAVFTVNVGAIGGYNSPVTLSVSGVPAGATSSFSTNPVTPVGTSVLTISNTALAVPGTYTLTITGNSVSGTKVTTVQLSISAGTPSAVTLTSPANAATGVAIPTNFTWSTAVGSGITYDIQVATDAAFTSIVDQSTGLASAAFTSSVLSTSTTYYWRVRVVSGCGSSSWSTVFSFTTNSCSTIASTVVPVTISATGTPTVTSTITVPTGGTITDVNVLNLVGTHTYLSDLTVTLTSPTGTSVVLFAGICTTTDNFNINFDAASALTYASIACPATGGGTYQPQGNLSNFNGQDAAGVWTLTITDGFDVDGGSLTGWALQLCVTPTVSCVNPTVPTISGASIVCAGNPTTLSIASGVLNDATAWEWYTGSCGGTVVGTGTSISVTPLTTTTYFVKGIGGCVTSGACAQVTVTVNPVSTTNVSASICQGSSYTFPDGTTSTVAITQTSTLTSILTGCDSIVVTTLTINTAPSIPTLISPANASAGITSPTTFTWNSSTGTGVTYVVQIATDAAFTSIVNQSGSLGTTSYTYAGLTAGTTYYWHVIATGTCSPAVTSGTNSFTTNSCVTTASTNVPIAISASGTPTITSTLNIPTGGTINDVNVLNLVGTHTWINDLIITLTSPSGTSVVLFSQICNNQNNFNVNFDDAAALTTLPCPPVGGGTYQPLGSLADFNGENSAGTWTLTIQDMSNSDGGSLSSWSLEICTDATLPCSAPSTPVVSVTNNCGNTVLTTSGTDLLWSTGEITPSITVTSAGTYTVTQTVGGCASSAGSGIAAPLVVPSAPVVTVTNNCGNSVLSATGSGLLWSTGATTASITVSSAGTYTVTQTVGGCISSAGSGIAAPLVVPSAPVVTVTNNCGNSVLSATGSGLLWSTGATTASITVTSAGTYTVTQTVGGCASSAGSGIAAPLVVPSAPVVTVTNNCGNSVLSATGSGLLWSNGATTASITVTSAGTYTVTQTVGGCASSAGSGIAAPLVVPTAPVVTVTNNCGNSVLSATGSGLLWSTGATTASITVTSAGTYTVTQTVGGCASSAGSGIAAPLVVPSAPVVTVTNNCGNSVLTATGSGLLWSTGATTASITVTSAGTYTVTQTSGSCTSAVSSAIANPLLNPVISQGALSNPTSCGASDGSIVVSGSGSGTVAWNGPVNNTANGITLPYSIIGLSAGTYTITFNDGCVSNSLTILLIDANAPASPIVSAVDNCGSSILTASGTNLLWSTGESTMSITVTVADAYTVTQTVGGCTSAPSTVNANPIAIPSPPAVTVVNNCGNSVLSATGSNLIWSTGPTTPSITVTSVGAYSVSQTVNSCTSLSTTVEAAPLTIPTVSLSAFSDVCINTAAFALSGGSPAGGTYSGTGVTNNIFDPSAAGYGTFVITYTFIAANGCSATAQKSITVGCAGVDEEESVIISIFPNPTNGQFTIEIGNNLIQSVSVYDAAGRLVKMIDTKIGESKLDVDLSDVASGTYSIELFTENGVYRDRLIVNK